MKSQPRRANEEPESPSSAIARRSELAAEFLANFSARTPQQVAQLPQAGGCSSFIQEFSQK